MKNKLVAKHLTFGVTAITNELLELEKRDFWEHKTNMATVRNLEVPSEKF